MAKNKKIAAQTQHDSWHWLQRQLIFCSMCWRYKLNILDPIIKNNLKAWFARNFTAWKVFKCGAIPVIFFIYGVNLCMGSEYRKVWTTNNSIFGNFHVFTCWLSTFNMLKKKLFNHQTRFILAPRRFYLKTNFKKPNYIAYNVIIDLYRKNNLFK